LVRVLVVDDSSFMRRALTHILEADTSIQVIDTGANGEDAVQKTKQLHPDVVLLDIEMPVMDGLSALALIMAESPTPVVMLSAMHKKAAFVAIDSLEQGAVDFIAKPSGVISYDIDELRADIVSKVKAAATAIVRRATLSLPHEPFLRPSAAATRTQIVVIGASTGGPVALAQVVSELPHNISTAILVVQHMSPEFVPALADKLDRACSLRAMVAKRGEVISGGRILVAPGGWDTTVAGKDGVKKIHLKKRGKSVVVAPSIDCTMESVAIAYGNSAVGVLLTGLGDDGARGMKAIKDAGGRTIVQDAATSVVFSMPKSAIDLGCVDKVVPLPLLAKALLEML
jgi:two-component system chemotaxis response regulator CheB